MDFLCKLDKNIAPIFEDDVTKCSDFWMHPNLIRGREFMENIIKGVATEKDKDLVTELLTFVYNELNEGRECPIPTFEASIVLADGRKISTKNIDGNYCLVTEKDNFEITFNTNPPCLMSSKNPQFVLNTPTVDTQDENEFVDDSEKIGSKDLQCINAVIEVMKGEMENVD